MNLKYLFKEYKYYKKLGGLKNIFVKFIFSKTPLKKVVNSSFYNKYYSNMINKKSKKSNTKFLQIENTNLCNATCVMCPHVSMKRKKTTMSFEDFKKITKNVIDHEKIKVVIITGFGEPFLDKTIVDKIKWLNQNYPDIKIDIYTNVSMLTPKITDKLLELKIHKINFSVNGTEKVYNKIMGLDYEKTKEHINYFYEQKKKLNKKFPLTNISLMIIKDNEAEIKKFINFWNNKSDSIMVYIPSDWAGKKKIDYVSEIPFKKKRWPCPALWQFITVDVEGNLIMCCRDYESIIKFGNLLKNNIKEIKNSNKFKDLQQKHLDFNFSTPVCSTCDNAYDSSLNWFN
ncbi:MAG: radical SAM protein [Nanoarchaeota archaeon]|nr:radical SAM protein [Nanoarchaeota archaeon]